jgi:hypothetical protein
MISMSFLKSDIILVKHYSFYLMLNLYVGQLALI